jgi:alpha,alpha-trehalase
MYEPVARETAAEAARGDRPIREYAAIGDCHGGALVALDGGIDWCCLDRFDADPLFCRLLDASRGGFLSTAPVGRFHASRAYLSDTNVLRTEFATDGGSVALTDFMPVGRRPGGGVHDYVDLRARAWLIRRIECTGGEVALRIGYRPSVAFGALPVELERAYGGIGIRGGGVVLHSDLDLEIRGADAAGEVTLRAGERRFIIIGMPRLVISSEEIERLYRITCAFWREWIGYCRYRGPYADHVRRSALILKLMTYAPTGALVAALTTSLPEEIGGERNWDYRYCWIRDSSLVLQALASIGYSGEVKRFYRYMRDALEAPVEELQIMYGIRMERDLTERELDHLAGYAGSRPVRTGNGAYSQRQTDLYGYLLEGALAYQALGGKIWPGAKEAYARVADFIAYCWDEPDLGLWEIRADPRHFVHSKAMCWVVVDRAIRLVGAKREWVDLRERMWREIMARGRAPDGHFVQAFGRSETDASLLQLAMIGAPVDIDTLARTRMAVERELRHGDFVHRYVSGDGLPGSEGAFLVCSFWLVDALLVEGRPADARALFERLCSYANDVGLFPEEIDRSGAFLGNFPQAFTHLGLVASAVNLELFEKHGAAALRGTYADRARRAVRATLGWRGVLAGWLHSRKLRLTSSRESILSFPERL